MEMVLLSESRGNTKLKKSHLPDYRIVNLALDPGRPQVCPHSTAGCRAICVGGESVGVSSVFPSVQAARRRKTEWLLKDRAGFEKQLVAEISHQERLADYYNQQLVVRPDTFSDFGWAHIARKFPDSRFYGYTKIHSRWDKILRGDWPENYHLCFSWSENPRHQEWCERILNEGGNIARVFHQVGRGYCGSGAYRQKLPGFVDIGGIRFPCWDGDHSDLRFLDPQADDWRNPNPGKGWLVGLRLKAGSTEARNQAIESGFSTLWDPDSAAAAAGAPAPARTYALT